MDELESALAQQAPPKVQDDPSLFELPPLIIDGIPTPVEKMTQAQLRAFIPLMLKYSTGKIRKISWAMQTQNVLKLRSRKTRLGSRFNASWMVAERASLGKCSNGCENRRRKTENQLDTRIEKDCHQLLQISRTRGSLTSLLRRGWKGKRYSNRQCKRKFTHKSRLKTNCLAQSHHKDIFFVTFLSPPLSMNVN